MERKKQFKYFTIFAYEKEQEYLHKMHKSGWKFVAVRGLGVYHFEKCEPEDVVYQLDYNQEGLKHKEEYVKMFADCGWEYIQDYAGYSYFRKPVAQTSGTEEIFCDDSSKIEMMERVYKGRLVPLLFLFFAVLMPQFVLNVFSYQNYVNAMLIGTVLALYIIVFAICAVNYYKRKSKK